MHHIEWFIYAVGEGKILIDLEVKSTSFSTNQKQTYARKLVPIFVIKYLNTQEFTDFGIKGARSSLRQFLATESPLKMMKNTFLFYLKSFFSQDI